MRIEEEQGLSLHPLLKELPSRIFFLTEKFRPVEAKANCFAFALNFSKAMPERPGVRSRTKGKIHDEPSPPKAEQVRPSAGRQ
jgi:hypothetical protein